MIRSVFRGRYHIDLEDGRRFTYDIDSGDATVMYRPNDPPQFVLEYPDGRVVVVDPVNPSGGVLVDQTTPADGVDR